MGCVQDANGLDWFVVKDGENRSNDVNSAAIRSNVARIIKAKGLTQEAVAVRMQSLGVDWSRRTVYRTAGAKDRDVRAHELAPLALSLGVSISELLVNKRGARFADLEPIDVDDQRELIDGRIVRVSWWDNKPIAWSTPTIRFVAVAEAAAVKAGWADLDAFATAHADELDEIPANALPYFIAQHPKDEHPHDGGGE